LKQPSDPPNCPTIAFLNPLLFLRYFDRFLLVNFSEAILTNAPVMSIDAIIAETAKIVRKYVSDEHRILLFGSQAKGSALPTSDIDIGILGKQRVPHLMMAKMRDEVDNLRTLRSVDVVDLLVLDEEYRRAVLSYGKEIQA
jgi:predicted nucleotidyltransferase